MKLVVGSLAVLALLATPARASGPIVAPPVTGPAQGASRQLHPPSALDQVRERAMQQSPPLPVPAQPREQWAPERRVYVPQVGREVVVPGHYERRLSDQQSAVPSLPGYDPNTGMTVTIPGGERPPAELRQSP